MQKNNFDSPSAIRKTHLFSVMVDAELMGTGVDPVNPDEINLLYYMPLFSLVAWKNRVRIMVATKALIASSLARRSQPAAPLAEGSSCLVCESV
ncbi:hypothetical protein GOZ78_21345 [Agrobacterium vitis]|uniref:Uncharacterized protein n=2 Tax=Agrobacterium TaxID=357 RepID=A0A2Z2PXZ7_AGRTU|nr:MULTISPECIES: hypothetical protein [Rhizobium/Agrobacterium group]MCF1501145.1 hypothetical protein [Allorhizobium sp. Av2]ASK47061.1 hypothetical protein [Agrobacterium radiobacter]KAA3509406.1 hypothetical protein DXM22_20785 [Agrobacterium vitis]KAA3522448.1 hypothetical protein DXT89_21855 [Agrobacterium vitis]MBF2712872.1 hypothetical protein [Agrobacterium vitis]